MGNWFSCKWLLADWYLDNCFWGNSPALPCPCDYKIKLIPVGISGLSCPWFKALTLLFKLSIILLRSKGDRKNIFASKRNLSFDIMLIQTKPQNKSLLFQHLFIWLSECERTTCINTLLHTCIGFAFTLIPQWVY